MSQVLLAGARLGAQRDFTPQGEYQPDVGPDPDLDAMRLRLAEMLDSVDTYSFVFDPYAPEVVDSQLSDDLTSIATDLEQRAAPLHRRRRRRGAVVVAVLLCLLVGQPRRAPCSTPC